MQDKNKYDSKKYRLVARRTNAKVIAQIIYSTMTGDRVLCAADSTELRNHGLTAGLTNYASCYATGLLLARRLLKQVGLSDMYSTNSDVNGEYFNVDDDIQDKRPFKALLDVGIARTTTGARVFGVLKGACDGGVNVPHNTKRFPGYRRAQVKAVVNKRGKKTDDTEKVEANFNAKEHRNRIMGNHVTVYMNALKKENADKFKVQFSQWDKCLTANKAKSCEDVYKKVHAAIIANPDRKGNGSRKEGSRKVISAKPQLVQQDSKGRKWIAYFRLTTAQRQEKVQAKFAAAMAALN
jgi:large subunit ribosomal protein L5e